MWVLFVFFFSREGVKGDKQKPRIQARRVRTYGYGELQQLAVVK